MGLVLTLLAIGTVLLLLETILPGMVAGILGFGCLVAAVACSYVEFGVKGGNFMLLSVSVGLVGGLLLWMKIFPQSALARKLVSRKVVGDIRAEQPELLHQTGVAYTALRPSGTATIQGRRVDVVTEGGMIERGAPIKVVGVEGMRVVVRAITPAEAQALQPQNTPASKSS